MLAMIGLSKDASATTLAAETGQATWKAKSFGWFLLQPHRHCSPDGTGPDESCCSATVCQIISVATRHVQAQKVQ